jgi:drug/metabolite transporter (DMT)-like permease
MIFVLFAILCSVTVSINLKLFKRYYTNAYQAIVFNYPTAALLCFYFFKPSFSTIPTINNWLLFFVMALLMLSIFYFISKSISTSGIVLTAIAQRLSLVIPVLAAFLIFNEDLSSIKIIGLGVGLLAICASVPSGKFKSGNIKFWYPVIVFTGTGVLDILFNMITKLKEISFTTALFYIFSIATILGFVSLFKVRKSKFQLKSVLAGIILGVFNFGSIYFYIKALHLESHRPSVIFSALDIGVIALGSLVGVILFKEKLSQFNKLGLVLAIIAICILTFS